MFEFNYLFYRGNRNTQMVFKNILYVTHKHIHFIVIQMFTVLASEANCHIYYFIPMESCQNITQLGR